jgi:hypothetical protein
MAPWVQGSLTAAFLRPDLPVDGKAPSAGCSRIIYSCNYHYTQPIVEVKRHSKQLFFRAFRLGVQNEPIAAAIQPTPHVCAAAVIVDLIAVADVEA